MEKGLNNYDGALQQSINSEFDAASTAPDIIKGINLTGRTAIVTGGYSWIGKDWKGFNPMNIIFTKGVTQQALDPATAKSLWQLSEQLTGVELLQNESNVIEFTGLVG
jgi:hypothetical protein